MQHPHENEQFISYLAQLKSHLRGMSASAQSRSLEETRQHLESVFAQLKSEGWSETDAAAEAIRRFGKPAEIGKRLISEWKLTRNASVYRLFKQDLRTIKIHHDQDALYFTLAMFGASFVVWMLFMFAGLWVLSYQVLHTSGDQWRATNSMLSSAQSVWYFLCPILVGWIVGKKTPERALMAVTHVLVSFGIFTLLTGVLSTVTVEHYSASRTTDYLAAWLAWIVSWTTLATASAYLAGCVERRRFYKPTAADFRFQHHDDDTEALPAN